MWVSWKASKTKWIGIPYKSHSQRGHTKRWARHTAKKSKELFHVEHCTVYSFVFLVLRFARLDTMQKKSWSMLITVQCTILFSCFLSRCLSIRLRVFQKKPQHKRNNSFHRHILGIVGLGSGRNYTTSHHHWDFKIFLGYVIIFIWDTTKETIPSILTFLGEMDRTIGEILLHLIRLPGCHNLCNPVLHLIIIGTLGYFWDMTSCQI